MKRIININTIKCISIMFAVFVGLLSVQNIEAGGISEYPGGTNNLQEFKQRLNEIMNDSELGKANLVYGSYAGSQNSLQEFKRRLDEIKQDGELGKANRAYGSYAGSQNSLQEFKRRFNEIMNDSELRNQ